MLSFEVWLADQRITPGDAGPGKCDQCGDEVDSLSTWGSPTCWACLRYSWGYDQGMESTLKVTVGAAILAALESDDPVVPEEVVRRAVERAFQEHHAAEYNRAYEHGRVCPQATSA